MTDVFTKGKRSEIMSKIRSRDTKVELLLKFILRLQGFKYHPRGIHGSPDFIHRSARIAVFVDGCFWHGCPLHFRLPKSNSEFWGDKIKRNKERDEKVTRELERGGWLVIRLWEHQVRLWQLVREAR